MGQERVLFAEIFSDRAVIHKHYKLISRTADPSRPLRHYGAASWRDPVQMYDLRSDVDEERNLISLARASPTSAIAGVHKMLSHKLSNHLQRTRVHIARGE